MLNMRCQLRTYCQVSTGFASKGLLFGSEVLSESLSSTQSSTWLKGKGVCCVVTRPRTSLDRLAWLGHSMLWFLVLVWRDVGFYTR